MSGSDEKMQHQTRREEVNCAAEYPDGVVEVNDESKRKRKKRRKRQRR